jgi:ketosteroid isomerase-like protein
VKSLAPSSIVIIALISGCACVAPSKPFASPQATIEAKFAAVNRHALDEIVNLYSPDAQITASDFCQPRHGREDVRRTYKALFDAFPNIGVEVHEYVVQGDRVAVRVNIQSKPPGFAFDVPIMNFFTVRNGLIESDEGRFDNGGRRCSP